ncbi:unnamed protein product, partial [Ixodes pacificus]
GRRLGKSARPTARIPSPRSTNAFGSTHRRAGSKAARDRAHSPAAARRHDSPALVRAHSPPASGAPAHSLHAGSRRGYPAVHRGEHETEQHEESARASSHGRPSMRAGVGRLSSGPRWAAADWLPPRVAPRGKARERLLAARAWRCCGHSSCRWQDPTLLPSSA